MTEQLEYKNIFDAITDDPAEAAEMKQKADQMIIDRDKSDLIFTYPKKGMKKHEK